MPNIIKTMFPGMDSVLRWIVIIFVCIVALVCCVGLANLYNDGKNLSAENATNKKTSEVVQQENTNTKQVQDKKEKADEITNNSNTSIDSKKDEIKGKTQEVLDKKKTKVDNVSPGKKQDAAYTAEEVKQITEVNIDSMWAAYCHTECNSASKI